MCVIAGTYVQTIRSIKMIFIWAIYNYYINLTKKSQTSFNCLTSKDKFSTSYNQYPTNYTIYLGKLTYYNFCAF